RTGCRGLRGPCATCSGRPPPRLPATAAPEPVPHSPLLPRSAPPIPLAHGRDQVLVESSLPTIVGPPAPVAPRRRVVHVHRPAVHDGLALQVRLERHLGLGERPLHPLR